MIGKTSIMKAVIILFVLFVSASGFIFECKYGNKLSQEYNCEVTVIASKSETTLLEVKGNHSEGKSNADVLYLSIYDQVIPNRFPKNIEKFFPNLESFDWYNGSLKSVTAGDLAPFQTLKVLSISGHKLVSLNADLLKNNALLEWINFRDNLIEHVGSGLLKDLKRLEIAIFHENPCINFNATTPEGLEELKMQLTVNCPSIQDSQENEWNSSCFLNENSGVNETRMKRK